MTNNNNPPSTIAAAVTGAQLQTPRPRGSILNTESPDRPVEVAIQVMDDCFTNDKGQKLLLRWRETWWHWDAMRGVWVELSDELVDGRIQSILRMAQFQKWNSAAGRMITVDWNPTDTKIAKVRNALKEIARVDDAIEFGDWLDPKNAGREVICCLRSRVEYDEKYEVFAGHPWKPSDAQPDLFNVTALNLVYDPESAIPDAWKQYLNSSFDEQGQQLLQEWTGYLVSGRQHKEKALQVLGPPRSGKGVYSTVVGKLFGRGDSRISLNALTESFALETLINAPYVIVGDARSARSTSGGRDPVEVLLEIIGNDPQRVNRKGKKAFSSILLPCRVMVFANKPVTLRDDSGALDARWLFLRTKESHVGNEDTGLKDRLTRPEILPGVLAWALVGLERLIDNGWKFTEQEAAREDRTDSQMLGSRIRQFVAENYEMENGCRKVGLKEFHREYQSWRDETGGFRQTMEDTKSELKSAGFKVSRPSLGGSRVGPWTVFDIKRR